LKSTPFLRRVDASRHPYSAALLLLQLLLPLLLVLAALPAHAITVIEQADALILRDGHAPLTKPVKLPFHWDGIFRSDRGQARLSIILPAAAAAEEALFVRRIGNSFRIRLDGVTLAAMGEPGNGRTDYGKRPRLFLLPAGSGAQPRLLEIEIDAQATRSGGLSMVLHGPRAAIEEIYQEQYLWRVNIYLAIGLISAVLGAVAFLIWLRQRDRLFLIYALSEFLWAFQMSDIYFEQTPLAWPWWGILVISARGISVMLMLKFVLGVMDREHSLLGRTTHLMILMVVPVMALALSGIARDLEVWLRLASESLVLLVALVVIRHGWRSRLLEQRILAYAMVGIALLLVRDLLVLVVLPYILPYLTGYGTWAGHYGSISWARYGWVLFGFALVWVIAERLRRTSAELEAANAGLAQRLAEREAELNAAHAREAQANAQRATLEERQRLMRDIHDGLGSQLVGAVQLAHDALTPRAVLAHALQDAVDNLKLTVDAMQDTDGDIASLLGSLRYRLAPRFRAAGIELAWEVARLPARPDWSVQHSRQLQLILFEAFSNLLAHSGASRACLSAELDHENGTLRVVLTDNGYGFDPAALLGGGHGLANMRARATQLGARLSLSSDTYGTCVKLELPAV
jgi:signal transduction histidine kinase